MYSKEQFAKMLDYALLRPQATRQDVVRYCDEAKRHHFASVCVFPFWVQYVARQLAGSDVKTCTVIGYPFGGNGRAVKLFEARNAITNGASELDVVVNISALKSGELAIVEREIGELVGSAQMQGMTTDAKRTLVKIIIETAYLTDREKITVCEIARDAGVEFLSTSTGTAPTGATVEDIRLIRNTVGSAVGVKAAGGIRNVDQALAMLNAGANRIGASNAVQIAEVYDPDVFLSESRR
ncbi:MAG: deoxyribose-phosphate aldolase [Armatimonadota bacterium]|nr:deoxyribose-phosphate aldolase [Armatimonadota bacterium]